MVEDDEDARKERAEKLRRQISRLNNQDDAGDDEEPAQRENARPQTRPDKSPRDFINERMRELDDKEE